MGFIFAGKEIEAAVVRDGRKSGAWWGRDEYGTGPRAPETNLLCGHWTAGEAGVKDPDGAGPLTSYDDDGPRVAQGMKNRPSEKRPGEKLQVSIQFIVGACEPDAVMAPIWQTMDLAYNSAVHVGERIINRRSIGIEVVNSGAHGGPLDARHRAFTAKIMNGKLVEMALFFPGQINALLFLARALTSHEEQTELGAALRAANIRIPRQVPFKRGKLLSERFTPKLSRDWKGMMEHFYVPSTKKIDAGLMFVDACRAAGFVGVEV